MEDDLIILANGRRPQYVDVCHVQDNINFGKWKATSIFWKTEEGLNIW